MSTDQQPKRLVWPAYEERVQANIDGISRMVKTDFPYFSAASMQALEDQIDALVSAARAQALEEAARLLNSTPATSQQASVALWNAEQAIRALPR